MCAVVIRPALKRFIVESGNTAFGEGVRNTASGSDSLTESVVIRP